MDSEILIDGCVCVCVCEWTEPAAAQDSNGSDREEIGSDIGQIYQIFPDEVLGSGQFGVVYGGAAPFSFLARPVADSFDDTTDPPRPHGRSCFSLLKALTGRRTDRWPSK